MKQVPAIFGIKGPPHSASDVRGLAAHVMWCTATGEHSSLCVCTVHTNPRAKGP